MNFDPCLAKYVAVLCFGHVENIWNSQPIWAFSLEYIKMYVYVCMYACVCVCMYVCMYVCVYVYVTTNKYSQAASFSWLPVDGCDAFLSI